MSLLEQDISASTGFSVNRKRSLEEFLDNSLLLNVGNSLKRHCLGLFSRNSDIAPGDSNQIALENNAFAKMENLKLLKLGLVRIRGSYENLPKKIRWLCWHGFPVESIPRSFPLEALVALEMPNSRLKHFWDGTKFLVLLKILNLSHSHSLAKTPDFIVLPNLERLILEDCTRLVEIHESVGHLARLVLLNLKDCSNLKNLPRSIVMLKSLETLNISGCSNLENLQTKMGNMVTLTVRRAENVNGITRSPATVQNFKAWYSFNWLLPLIPKRTPETSWASSLPRSLVKLSLVSCNLSDDAFPTDLGNLSLLRELDLSDNPITNLPDSIRCLTVLKLLRLNSCLRLRSLLLPPQELEELSLGSCSSLTKITPLSPAIIKLWSLKEHRSFKLFILPTRRPRRYFCSAYRTHVLEFSRIYKLEPIGDVDKEVTDNLGLFHLGTMRNLNVRLGIPFSDILHLPLQGCHEKYVFYTYLPGSKIPEWFNLTNEGTSLSFTVPHHNFRIRGLSLCIVYSRSCSFQDQHGGPQMITVIANTTKRLIWIHSPEVYGIPEANEDMVWLSYWKFENQVDGGDEMSISVPLCRFQVKEEGVRFQVKEVGVRLLYDVEKLQKITQQSPSTIEEVSGEIYRYGLIELVGFKTHPSWLW